MRVKLLGEVVCRLLHKTQDTQKEKQKYILFIYYSWWFSTFIYWVVDRLQGHSTSPIYDYEYLEIYLITYPYYLTNTSLKQLVDESSPVISWIEHVIYLLPLKLMYVVSLKAMVIKMI